MFELKILQYIRKWYLPIAAFSVILCMVFTTYINKQQTYTASVMIRYIGADAQSGLTPTGEEIDTTVIYSSRVIANVIRDINLNTNVDFIRSRIKVNPVTNEDKETIKLALLERGEEYDYFPTDYIISFTVGAGYSTGYARTVLDAVVRMYCDYYTDNYINLVEMPTLLTGDIGEYDFIERVEIIDQSLTEVIDYLSARSIAYPLFYSAKAGYSFTALLNEYKLLYDLNIYKLYAEIQDNHVTQDAELLVRKYEQRQQLNMERQKSMQELLLAVKSVIDEYAQRSIEGMLAGTGTNEDGEKNDMIVSALSNYYIDRSITTYDQLINQYITLNADLQKCEEDIKYCNKIISIFDDGSQGQSAESVTARLDNLVTESITLYKNLDIVVNEFNDYLSAQNISVRSSISTALGMNTSLYITIAAVLFILIGCVGAIVIGRISDIAKEHIYTDAKTGLPNRLSCDNVIERLSHSTLPPDTVCVAISLDNLLALNQSQGRKQGDVTLRNFGSILKRCAEAYGFIGYNGGQDFIAFFERCTQERAILFIEALENTVKKYNESFDPARIIHSWAMCESKAESMYDIRDLLKHTISTLRMKRAGGRRL